MIESRNPWGWWGWLGVAGAVVIASLSACSKPPEKAEAIRPARVMTVQRSSGADLMVFAGEVRPRYEIDVAFRIGGKLLERRVDMGTAVSKGQPLARLDPQDARLSAAAAAAQVAAADADLAFAKAELDRSRQLLDQKFISQAAYDNKISSFNVAAAKRESARAQSAVSGNQALYTTLVADTSGVITSVLAEAGQVVSAGQPVMKLARTEEREVTISVAENQTAALKVGTPALISLWAVPGKIYQGRVREIAPAADALTRTYLVRVSVLDGDPALRWGMTANVAVAGMRSSAMQAGTIVVPLTALNQQGQSTQVWLVGANNAVQSQQVQVAQYLDSGAVITAGLSGGETIVVAGVHKLNPGEVVKPLPEPQPDVANGKTIAPQLATGAAAGPAGIANMPATAAARP